MRIGIMTEEDREKLTAYREYAKAALMGFIANPNNGGANLGEFAEDACNMAEIMLHRERLWIEQEGAKHG